MSESIESLHSRPPLEVVELPIDSLDPDPANPNRVDVKLMEALRLDIAERGFVQPVLVRPAKGGRYTVIDGEHRWKVLKGLEAKTVPCVIDEADDDQARMRLLTMNRLRGRFNTQRLAGVLKQLASQTTPEELMTRLGMAEEEFDSSLKVADEGELGKRLAEALAREDAAAPEVLRFKLGPRQYREVEKAVEKITASGQSRGEALIALLEQP